MIINSQTKCRINGASSSRDDRRKPVYPILMQPSGQTHNPSLPNGMTTAATVALVMPPGTPSWITPELVAMTLKVWQPFYTIALSVEEAVAIILSVGRLFRVFSGGTSNETLCRTGPCQQP